MTATVPQIHSRLSPFAGDGRREGVPQPPDRASLIESMKKAYPDAGLGIALEIGAKVGKGEMKW
jgi:hypothetical protein